MNALQILVVEDNPIQSKIVENRLKQCGVIHVDVACDGQEALNLLKVKTFDLMLIDVLMDGMDGITLINELHYNDVNVPFYITSSLSAESLYFINEMGRQFELPILGVLPKPITLDVLKPLLQKLLPDAKKQTIDVQKKYAFTDFISLMDENQIEVSFGEIKSIRTNEVDTVTIKYKLEKENRLISWADVLLQEGLSAADQQAQVKAFEQFTDLAIDALPSEIEASALPILSFNVSVGLLENSAFFDMINHYFNKRKIPHNRIVLEVDEIELVNGYKAILPGITRARIHGYTVAIGSIKRGYQSLLTIRELPISEIRLDEALIENCDRIISKNVLISSLIKMAKIESIKSTAVGVNSSEELSVLKNLSCEYYRLKSKTPC